MRSARWLPALVPLLLCLACQPHREAAVYGPWEEGLTLVYENPTEPQPMRTDDRLQVRVAQAKLGPGPASLVTLNVASQRGQMSLLVRHRDGGIDLVAEDGRVLSRSLPPGFPATAGWSDRGAEFRVLGRATWEGAALLPPGSEAVGIWVETIPAQGPRRRALFLPNLGEVEALEAREGGWVCVNRLVARGFTDLPAIKRP